MLALLLHTALAAELDLSLSWTEHPEPVQLTVRDVTAGPLPGLVARGVEKDLRFEVAVTPVESTQVRMDIKVFEVQHTKRGVQERLVSQPTLLALVGEPAMVRQGSRGPDGSERFVELQALWRE